MVKNIGRRFLSFFMTAVMVLMLLPEMTLPTFAATSGTVTGLTDTNIGLSFSETSDGAWVATGVTITGSVSGQGDGCGGYSSTSSKLTITNNSGSRATLSFDYTVALGNGTVKINNESKMGDGKFSLLLGVGETVEVEITSAASNNITEIKMTSVSLDVEKDVNAAFAVAEGGSYTVTAADGSSVTVGDSHTQFSTEAYTVTASPNTESGYSFVGWYGVNGDSTETLLRYTKNSDGSYALYVEYDCTVKPRFMIQGTIFGAGNAKFDDLGVAMEYAVNNGYSQVTLLEDTTIEENYTIPSGVTLLIPYNIQAKLSNGSPEGLIWNGGSNWSRFRTLTLADGKTITVEGAIEVGGAHGANSSGGTGITTGMYGLIDLQGDSSIIIENGGLLYAWGYIIGDGRVEVKSGGAVYEYFQIMDWRGGQTAKKMSDNKKVFLFSQYYTQNIEAELILNYGATEWAHVDVATSDEQLHPYTFKLISANDGLFRIKEGGILTRKYRAADDRILYTVAGNVELSSIYIEMTVTVLGSEQNIKINSSDYVVPINSNTEVIVLPNANLTASADVALLPEAKIIIQQGGNLKFADGVSMFVYDSSEWKTDLEYVYPSGSALVQLQFVASTSKAPASRKIENDATIDVNGTLTTPVITESGTISKTYSGGIYTTSSGANITSSEGTGKIVMGGEPGKATETQQVQKVNWVVDKYVSSVDYATISITPAKLKNAEDNNIGSAYTQTSNAIAGDVFYYCKTKCGGVWHKLAGYPVAQSTSTTLYDGSDTAALADETAQTFETLTDAINSTTNGTFIRLLHDVSPEKVQMTDDVHLDLNGCNAHVDFTGDGTVYAIDSATDYELDDDHSVTYSEKAAGKITGTTLPDKFAKTVTVTGDGVTTSFKRYVMVQDGAAYSFHRFNISTTGFRVLFDPTDMTAVIYYSGIARGDAKAAEEIKEYGFIFDDDKKSYKASDATIDAEFESALAWGGILDPSNVNTKYGAQAYLTFKNGGTQASMKVQMSLLDGLAYAYNNGGLSMPNAVGETTEQDIKNKLDAVMQEMGLGSAWSDAKTKENWKSAKTA